MPWVGGQACGGGACEVARQRYLAVGRVGGITSGQWGGV